MAIASDDLLKLVSQASSSSQSQSTNQLAVTRSKWNLSQVNNLNSGRQSLLKDQSSKVNTIGKTKAQIVREQQAA